MLFVLTSWSEVVQESDENAGWYPESLHTCKDGKGAVVFLTGCI